MGKRILGIAFFMVLVVSDQITKALAAKYLADKKTVEVIRNFFYLTYTENTGAAWSIFRGQKVMFIVVGIAALAAFLYWYTKSERIITRWALVLMAAGALGNLLDRLTQAGVRDFLDFYIFGYDFPIFNGADSILCIGAGLMLLDIILEEKHGNKTNPGQS